MNWRTDTPETNTLAALRMHATAETPRAALAIWMGSHWLTWAGAARAEIAAVDVACWCAVPMWPAEQGRVA